MKNYKKGMIITCRVTGITNYGIFVKLDNFNEGLIHISEISDNFVANINNYVNMNELIRARIIDKKGDDIYSLSIKKLNYRILTGRKTKIEETRSGFSNLALHLDFWIYKELENLKKNNKF